MPMPITTVLLVISAVLTAYKGVPLEVIGLVFAGLALVNETLRTLVAKTPSSYDIPAVPRERRIRNPLVPQDPDGS